jgi:hypothetical protein
MKDGVRNGKEHIEEALDAADMAWWSLEFPSGALSFSQNKTRMLGYEAKDFIHYTHFTSLIHPDDYDASMKAMSDHYSGKTDTYNTIYRIKASNNEYIKFHDKGRIVERNKGSFIVAGIVSKIE